MTDIVERLLNWECGLANEEADVVREAADEIERLLRACKDKTQLLTDAYAQIERLRAALDEQAAR